MEAVGGTSWQTALHRAAALTGPPVMTESEGESWDDVAVRGLIAIAIIGVAARDQAPTADVALSAVLAALLDEQRLRTLVAEAIDIDTPPSAGVGRDRTPAAMWAWLTRAWDPDEPGRWDGLPRGIARALPDPAVDVCLHWAAAVVSHVVEAERGSAIPSRSQVLITGGPLAGYNARVEKPAWAVTADGRDLVPGPADAYLVTIRAADGHQHHVVPRGEFAIGTAA